MRLEKLIATCALVGCSSPPLLAIESPPTPHAQAVRIATPTPPRDAWPEEPDDPPKHLLDVAALDATRRYIEAHAITLDASRAIVVSSARVVVAFKDRVDGRCVVGDVVLRSQSNQLEVARFPQRSETAPIDCERIAEREAEDARRIENRRLPPSLAPTLEAAAMRAIARRIRHEVVGLREGDEAWAEIGEPLRVALDKPKEDHERLGFLDDAKTAGARYVTRYEDGRLIQATGAFRKTDATCVMAKLTFWQLFDGFRFRDGDMRVSLSAQPVPIACANVSR